MALPIIRDNKTILELKEDQYYEWEDGDDGALYEAGWQEGIDHAIALINNVLSNKDLDTMPASWILKMIAHTLSNPSS